ncbi:MAG TPA: tryptophan 2,3-dioxygenase family protein [Gammaproteobacteria bacterium]|nr:tryptophan 2,3-dioxygenase family protein [Gammaproteobacteria bacterium]
MKLPDEIVDCINNIEHKYSVSGQDLRGYLEGLLYAKSLTYWDYIHLETLLSIQQTKTNFLDEKIFIIYHQITELYFSLILHELRDLCENQYSDKSSWMRILSRINRYFRLLIDSFEIMIKGLKKEEFLKFRMSLLPASGFQSVQYRMIELYSTYLYRLVQPQQRSELKESSLESQFNNLYWKFGNITLKSSEKTLTLQHFEAKYHQFLWELAQKCTHANMAFLWDHLPPSLQTDEELIKELQLYDAQANEGWRRRHFKAAAFHLHQEPNVIRATGGTNWQEYLPPKKQHIRYFEWS